MGNFGLQEKHTPPHFGSLGVIGSFDSKWSEAYPKFFFSLENCKKRKKLKADLDPEKIFGYVSDHLESNEPITLSDPKGGDV